MERAQYSPVRKPVHTAVDFLLRGRGEQPTAAGVLPGGRGCVGRDDHWVSERSTAGGDHGVCGAEQLLGTEAGSGPVFSGAIRLVNRLSSPVNGM